MTLRVNSLSEYLLEYKTLQTNDTLKCQPAPKTSVVFIQRDCALQMEYRIYK